MTEYGRIHTDGSRSGGQPAQGYGVVTAANYTSPIGGAGVATQSDALKAENEQLRHDLERQMTIANEHVNEAERLRRALAHIAFSGADGPYGEFGEALNEHQMRRVAKAALKEQIK